MKRIAGVPSVLLAAFLLAGCSGKPVPPSKLVRPAVGLMVAPGYLPDLREGEDIGQHAQKVRRMYGHETLKLRRLQRYVRTVTE